VHPERRRELVRPRSRAIIAGRLEPLLTRNDLRAQLPQRERDAVEIAEPGPTTGDVVRHDSHSDIDARIV